MPTIEELTREEMQSNVAEPQGKVEEQEESVSFGLPNWLAAQSPDVPVQEYLNHPLNFDHSEGLGQTLRGLEGMLGTLRYAVLDVILGLFKWSKENFGKKGVANEI